MADRRRHNRRRNRGRMSGLYRVVAVFLALAAITAGCIVFFRVRTIRVEGSARYAPEEVIAASGLEEGSYLALLDTMRMTRQIRAQLPYVERASIRRQLPDTVVITVEESAVAAAVKSQDQWWLVNGAGKLLETATPEQAAAHPLLTGLELLSPEPGLPAMVAEEEANRWNCAMALLSTLEERGDLEKLGSVDCGSAGQFTAVYDGRYTLLLPTTVEYVPTTAEDFGHFFSLLDQALPQLEQGGQNLVDFTLWESTGRIYARYAQ